MTKKILITGKSGYIARSLAAYLSGVRIGLATDESACEGTGEGTGAGTGEGTGAGTGERIGGRYTVESISVRDPAWKSLSFSPYDIVFHSAGIVHQSKAPETLYTRVNRDLAVEVAIKAKEDGVKQFIFMSTMAVYGATGVVGKPCEINAESPLKPDTPYGRSKLEAETLISAMDIEFAAVNGISDAALESTRATRDATAADDHRFKVCVIRAPMVYGGGCPGNYRSLRNLALRFGVAPDFSNERSALYIKNLCEFVRILIDRDSSGLFCPRDKEPFNTAQIMEWIAAENGKTIKRSGLLGVRVKPASLILPALRKAFGNLTYDPALSVIPLDEYCKWRLRDAIRETEAGFQTITRG